MDKKSITGLILIAGVLIVFSLFSPKQSAELNNSEDSQETVTQNEDQTGDSSNTSTVSHLVPKTTENGGFITDPEKGMLYTDTVSGIDTFIVQENAAISADTVIVDKEDLLVSEEEIITLESDVLILDFSTKGGLVKNVYLKDYRTYDDYVNEREQPLQLFDSASTFGITYKVNDALINSSDLDFKVVEKKKDKIVFESRKDGKTIGFTYQLKPGKYDLDYKIHFEGLSDAEVASANFVAEMKLLSTEKHYPNEQLQAAIFWQYEGDDYDYITRKSEELEEKIDWISFRQTFFTAMITAKNGFSPDHSTVAISEFEDETQKKYIKKYNATANLGATSAGNIVELNWYFGPVDYDLLATYDKGYEDIVELGPGLFRWINKYALHPMFNSMLGAGIGVGFAILLLTIIVKLVLSPVNYKMYKSSAMMKVLKPEIEKIAKQYPKKEDAMKKQQATMALYRETGVSPLAGCIPMLIQMPILFAIFRLFPGSIALRQKSFWWAEDLSSYDSPIHIGVDIPFYGDHISIFTLLMAGTTLLYTHYNSSNMQQPTQEGMPNLKYIMYFFPIMMIFFFNSYSSGLTFYYFISTLMTIGIMFAIKKFFIDEDKILAKIEDRRANPKKKGKSKFQQRLEEAQRLQQEKSRGRKKK
ncbi:MAG: membrane protein insertase YidC [Crocinitomicaceae bacterium]